jgi:hypothetical protein
VAEAVAVVTIQAPVIPIRNDLARQSTPCFKSQGRMAAAMIALSIGNPDEMFLAARNEASRMTGILPTASGVVAGPSDGKDQSVRMGCELSVRRIVLNRQAAGRSVGPFCL